MDLIDYITDQCDAVREKDGTTALIPYPELASRIRAIPSGGGPGPVTGYAEIEFPAELRTGTLFTFISSTGETFFSTSTSTSTGIWKLDKDSKQIIRIFDTGYYWGSWFEDSKGTIFTSSSNSVSPAKGVYCWDGETFIQIYDKDTQWSAWLETSQGNLFIGIGSTSGAGLLLWNGSVCKQVSGAASGSAWYPRIEDFQGNVFITCSIALDTHWGMYMWTNGKIQRVSNIRYITSPFVDSKGNIFASAGSSTSGPFGIFKFDRNTTTFTQVLTIGSNWQYWFEDSQGNVFVSSNLTVNKGIYRWDGETFIQVLASGYSWQYWFEDSQGNVFVSANTSATGIYRWNGETFIQALTSGYSWQYWFEDSQGNVFVSCGTSNATGIYRWNGDGMFTQIFIPGYAWKPTRSGNDIIFTSSSMPYRLRYSQGEFIYTDTYAAGEFGTKYSIQNSRWLWQGNAVKLLPSPFGSIVVNGDYAAAVSTDKTTLLYIE